MRYTETTAPPPDPRTQSKRERLDRAYFMDAMAQTEYDLLHHAHVNGQIPQEWHEIAHDPDARNAPTVKITLRVDANVVRFFKAMGHGYQHRMNRVLKAFVHGRLSRMVNGPDTSDFVMRPEEVLRWKSERPEWGHFERARAARRAEVTTAPREEE